MENLQYDAFFYALAPMTDLIIDIVYELVIEVIPLELEPEFDLSEIQFYGDDYGDGLLFQTVGFNNQPQYVIECAIMWYASSRLDYPQMQLSKCPK